MMAKAAMRRRHTGRSLWRLNLGMALFWLVALGVMYVAMERYLQPSEAVVLSNGGLQLQRQRDGHFYADGSINGQPVRFMVDTGASSIAVSDALAQRAGVEGGQMVQFQTANGPRMGRLVRAQKHSGGAAAGAQSDGRYRLYRPHCARCTAGTEFLATVSSLHTGRCARVAAAVK